MATTRKAQMAAEAKAFKFLKMAALKMVAPKVARA